MKDTTTRKTKWDVIAVEKDEQLIVINSSIANKVTKLGLEAGWFTELTNFSIVKPEFSYGKSRLDFLLKHKDGKKAL